jgi:Phosphoketolase
MARPVFWARAIWKEHTPNLHRKKQDVLGLREFFKQFSFPGGIGSHCTPETPGSIHEGGELGYVLSHACGAAFDNRDLIVAAVVGDGESETGPLATSWHISKFLNPIRDGAVLPILHLNGYKINNPTLLARISHQELEELMRGYGWTPNFVEGSDPDSMHQAMAATVEHCIQEIREHQQECRRTGVANRPRWPMIVLRSPKGWGAPKEVGGHRLEGFWRAHQVPLTDVKKNPRQLQVLEAWMREQKPEELFDENGKFICGAQGTRAHRDPTHERQSSRQWRNPKEEPALARLRRLRVEGRPARND